MSMQSWSGRVSHPAERTRAAGSRRCGPARRLLSAIGGLAAVVCLGACEVDAWLFDPSVVGRWENTPTIVPILERIDIIERDEMEDIEITQITPEDLVPVVREYAAGPGDVIRLEIFDFMRVGEPYVFERGVDSNGRLEIPQVGYVRVHGLTADQIRDAVGEAVVRADITREAPLIIVSFINQREQTYSVFGAIGGVGRYFIPSPNFRLLEALTESGGLSPVIKKVHVIRQIALTDEAQGLAAPLPPPPSPTTRPSQQPTQDGKSLTDLIEELTRPSPGQVGSSWGAGAATMATTTHVRRQPDAPPPIDLIEDEPDTTDAPPTQRPVRSAPAQRWVFLNGQWVQASDAATRIAGGLPEAPDPLAGASAAPVMTQRIIEVPTAPLLKGVAQYNIVIRPGDVIHVPAPMQGVFYLGGPGISRPGVYNLPAFGRLTLKQAIHAGGGLGALAIPERVDLVRRIGDDREATIRLNMRAIFEGTHPDIYVKPDDQINVGTHFFAYPMAVIRNGFRMSYGFGFLLDRNFGNDVFGAPPINRRN